MTICAMSCWEMYTNTRTTTAASPEMASFYCLIMFFFCHSKRVIENFMLSFLSTGMDIHPSTPDQLMRAYLFSLKLVESFQMSICLSKSIRYQSLRKLPVCSWALNCTPSRSNQVHNFPQLSKLTYSILPLNFKTTDLILPTTLQS